MQTNQLEIITSAFDVTGMGNKANENNRSEENNTDQFKITDCHFLTSNDIKSRIDYLTIQFKPNTRTEFDLAMQNINQYLVAIGLSKIKTKPNLKFFDDGYLLQALDSTKNHCGAIKWRNCFSVIQLELSGKGCAYFNTNDLYLFPLIDLSKHVASAIKRLDIALDSHDSKHGMRFAQQAYSRGLYKGATGGNPLPELKSSPEGKSFTIGSRHSRKQLVIYEKGKQLKFHKSTDEYKNWVRFEVRLRSRVGASIPIDSLILPDEYFVGAYPKANQRLIKSAKPRCIRSETIKTIDKKLTDKLAYAKHQVGKTIYGAVNRGLSSEVIVSKIVRKSKRDNIEYPSFVSQQDLSVYPFDK